MSFDGNYNGVYPRISKGTIISIDSGISTHTDPSSEYIYKLKLSSGNIVSIDETQILSTEDN